jgi:hypothetical protein
MRAVSLREWRASAGRERLPPVSHSKPARGGEVPLFDGFEYAALNAAVDFRRRLKPCQPFTDEAESTAIHGVDARPASLFLQHQPGVFEDPQVPRRRRPLVREATRDFTRGRGAPKMNRQKDLSPRRVRQRGDDSVERRKLVGCVVVQSGSTSQIVSSSSTGPIGSHTAMISGV